MNNLVIYSSRNGNTMLIANAIAEKLHCGIVNLNEVEFDDIDLKEIDTVFLGSGIYGGTLHRKILNYGKFLNSKISNRKKALKIAFFISWLGRGKSDLSGINQFRRIVHSDHFEILDNYFKCFGESFKFIRKHHPDKIDLNNAAVWAGLIASGSNNRE